MLLLLITVGGLAGFDKWFGGGRDTRENEIAEIVAFSGDARVKYTGELQWQTGREKQKLIYNDSIFSGPNSKVALKISNSDLNLDANTLIVLRKDRSFNSLNVNYGNLSGRLAKGDHFVIESANGEKFELSGTLNSKFTITRNQGKIVLKILEGNAKLIKDGKPQNLSSRDTVSFGNREKTEINPLLFTSPKYPVRYGMADSESVEFTWHYTSGEIPPDAGFTFEVSDQPTFQTVLMREQLSVPTFTANMNFPTDIYYRVKDGQGNHSETRRLILLRPQSLSLIEPANNSSFTTEAGQNYPLQMVITAPTPESKAVFQVARDPNFQSIVAASSGLESKYQLPLPIGRYFIRARLEYKQLNPDFTPMTSEWTNAHGFSIREKIDLSRMAKLHLKNSIIIPNIHYPAHLYSAAKASAQAHLATTSPFFTYFKDLVRPGHELTVRNSHGQIVHQNSHLFPAAWIQPGQVRFTYQLEADGAVTLPPKTHSVFIEMEAPNELKHKGQGNLSWSPILFAKSYEGEVRSEGVSETIQSPYPHYKLGVREGTTYSYRVRAIGANDEPISGWSLPHEFRPEVKKIEPILQLAENESAGRQPASVESSTSAIKIEEKKSAFQRAVAWLWAGTGINYLNVKQTIANTAEVNYQNTKSGSVFIEGGWWAKRRWGMAASYKRTPGDIRVDNYPVSQRSFIWDTYTLEALYDLPWVSRLFGRNIGWGIRAGVQKHSFPFLFVAPGNTLVQSQSEMLAGSIGFFSETEGRLKFHWNMRYQQPMQSSTSGGNSFSVTPKVAFDGSVGTSYNLSQHLKTGLFWYGQLHDYKFNYKSPTQTNTGEQTLFYSNMELRMGLDF